MGHGGSRWYSPKITLELYIVWDNHTNSSLKISITIYVVTLELYIVGDNYTNFSLKISNPTHHKTKNDQNDFSLFRKSGHCVWRDWRIKTGVVPGKQLGCFSPKPDYDDDDVGKWCKYFSGQFGLLKLIDKLEIVMPRNFQSTFMIWQAKGTLKEKIWQRTTENGKHI